LSDFRGQTVNITFHDHSNRDLTLGLDSRKGYVSMFSSNVSFESSEIPLFSDDETCLCICGFGYNKQNLCGS